MKHTSQSWDDIAIATPNDEHPIENPDAQSAAPMSAISTTSGIVGLSGTMGAQAPCGWNVTTFNPNILHNWDFRNPVNQRGQTQYQNPGGFIYTIDRWRSINPGTVTIMNGFIELSTAQGDFWFEQIIENHRLYFGKVVTLSVLLADGSLLTATGRVGVDNISIPVGSNVFVVMYEYAHVAQLSVSVAVRNPTLRIQAVKLELGTVSTLTNDPPMDFGKELMVCKRYYECYQQIGGNAVRLIATRDIHMPGLYTMPGGFEVEKRINPHLRIYSSHGNLTVITGTVVPIIGAIINQVFTSTKKVSVNIANIDPGIFPVVFASMEASADL